MIRASQDPGGRAQPEVHQNSGSQILMLRVDGKINGNGKKKHDFLRVKEILAPFMIQFL